MEEFKPLSTIEYESAIENARQRVKAMDKLDAENGLAKPIEVGEREVIRVAITALEAALCMKDWACAFEAMVYLEQAAQVHGR